MSDPINSAPLPDDVFQNRIAAALRELDHTETDADLAAVLDAIDAEPFPDATFQRILGQVRSSIRASRTAVSVPGRSNDRMVAGELGMTVRSAIRPHRPASQIPIVIACSALVAVMALLFQQFGDVTRERIPPEEYAADPPGPRVLLAASEKSNTEVEALLGIAPAQRVATGDTISTGPREKRRITLPDGSVLSINELSQVTIVGHRRLKLLAGEVFVEVVPANFSPAGQVDRFVVETPQRSVTALGTKFVVKADGKATNVVVTQGKVQVSGVDQILPAGQELIADLDDSHSAQVIPARRSAFVVEWIKDLMAAAGSAVVPFSEHSGGSMTVVDPQGQPMKLSLRKFHVDVHIEDGFARTTIDQTYFNHTWQQLEGTFRFPLPADASLSRLAMYVNGTLMEGGMVERDHGRNVFEQIRHTRRDPALLEWVDGSTFQMRVFPLEPRQEKRILLSYSQRLASDYGKSIYRFPSGHNLEGVKEWSTHVRVKDAAGTKWYSPSHLLTGRDDQGDLIIDGRDEYAILDRDLVLEFGETAPATQVAAGARWSAYEQDGFQYVMLRLRPVLKTTAVRAPRHWIFLIENSADRNEVLAETQRLIARTLLENVEHSDTFSVIRAGTRPDLFRPRPVDCSLDNVAEALRFLNEIAPIGALDLQQGLQAVQQQVLEQRENWLVHLGTGIPVLGERDDTTLRRLLSAKTRYVGVAVGKRWSKSFMEAAATQTGGHVTQINPDDAVAWRAFDLLSTLNAPRLTEISIQAVTGPGVVGAADPGQFLLLTNSLAHGQELVAASRFATGRQLPQDVTVTGMLDGQPFTQTIALPRSVDGTAVLDSHSASSVVPGTSRSGHLPRTWARCEIDRLVALGSVEHKARIIELSKSMYVMSPFTSLLVLETEAMYAQFNVDRGRKDHWALYATPDRIPVISDNSLIQAAPLEAARERLKAAQARVKAAHSNLERSVAEKRPMADVQRLERLQRAEQADLKLLEVELRRLEQAQAAAADPVRKAWDSVITRRCMYDPRYVQLTRSDWGLTTFDDFNGNGLGAGTGLDASRFWYKSTRLSELEGLELLGEADLNLSLHGSNSLDGLVRTARPGSELDVRQRLRGTDLRAIVTLSDGSEESPFTANGAFLFGSVRQQGFGRNGANLGQLFEIPVQLQVSDLAMNGIDWEEYHIPPAAMMGRPGPMIDGTGPGVLPMLLTQSASQGMWAYYPNSAVTNYPRDYVATGGLVTLGTQLAFTTWGDGELMYSPLIVVRDLPSYAPGLQSWTADRLAVAAKAMTTKPKSGDVDIEARRLIDKARSLGWETVKLNAIDQAQTRQAAKSLVVDGSGRFVLQREIGEGLQETVINDGAVLWHLYPEIGLGAKRSLSRFHQSTIQSLIPWHVPAVDDLSLEADIKLVAERTIRIIPITGDAESPAERPLHAVELVFAETGRLSEARMIDIATNKVLARQVMTADGLVQRFDGAGKLLAEVQFERAAAQAPGLVPETSELVILPMPYRSSAGLPISVPADLQTNAPDYTKLSDDDALMLVGTYFAESRPNELLSLIQSRYTGRSDHRLGFAVLMTSIQPQNVLVTQATTQHPDAALAKYLEQFVAIALGHDTAFHSLGDNASPFLRRISSVYNQYRQWLGDPQVLKAKSPAELERQLAGTLAVARECRTSRVADRLLTTVYSQLKSAELMNPGTARQLNATATDIATAHNQPDFLRANRIEWLLQMGDAAAVTQAKELFRSQLADANTVHLAPHLNGGTRAAFVKQFQTAEGQSCGPWADLVRDAARQLAGDNVQLRRVQLARQCLDLKEPALATEIMRPVLDDHGSKTEAVLNLAILEYAKAAGNWELAQRCIQQVLANAKLNPEPKYWRDAANIAHNLRKFSAWIEHLEHASQLEFAALPKTVNLDEFRNSYRLLFDQLSQRADQLVDATQEERWVFARMVQRAAGRWRDIDVDDTDVCHRTAKILNRLGFADAAWNYWTSPLAEAPDQSTVWTTFATAMNDEHRFQVADRAWSTAFECESTNPELLLKHAQFLRTIGQQHRAHEMLTRITTSTWQPRFENIKTQAQAMLTAGPLPQLKP
ncbi:MAG: FecR domain-containing protein [Planctomycetes bacterium]|nr:FecR domain-containing protein [Planctomycetota bacterium]